MPRRLCALFMGWWLTAVCLAGSPGLALAGGGPEPLGLLACIDLAQRANSQVGQTQSMEAWEKEKLAAAQRRFFPRLDLDLANQPKVDYFGRPVDDRETYSSDLKLTQTLYTGGQLTARHDQAKQGLTKVGLTEAKSRLEVALEVVPVYYKLLSARQVATLGQDLSAKAAELVQGARQGVREGYQRLEDLLHAEARLLEVSYKVADNQSQARAAAMRLKELLGLEREQALELKPQAPQYAPPESAEGLLGQALKKNASLLQAQSEELYQSLGLSVAETLSMPRLSLVGRYGMEGEDFPGPDKYSGVMLQCDISFGDASAKTYYDYEHQKQNETSFYFKDQELHRKGLKLSFLDGSSSAVSLAEARYLRKKAHDDVRDTRAKLQTQVLSLWEELKRHDDLYDLAGKQVELGGERVAVARAKREAGTATPAEVLEREMDLAEARAKMIQAGHERHRALALLCLLSGQALACEDVK
ncbi:MAG: TolC family protein [Desulfarculus sp.]|nr:TolC family protein [Desulfarculus sp.]